MRLGRPGFPAYRVSLDKPRDRYRTRIVVMVLGYAESSAAARMQEFVSRRSSFRLVKFLPQQGDNRSRRMERVPDPQGQPEARHSRLSSPDALSRDLLCTRRNHDGRRQGAGAHPTLPGLCQPVDPGKGKPQPLFPFRNIGSFLAPMAIKSFCAPTTSICTLFVVFSRSHDSTARCALSSVQRPRSEMICTL